MARRTRAIPSVGSTLNSRVTQDVILHPSGVTYSKSTTFHKGDQFRKLLTGSQVTDSVSNPAWKGLKSGHFKGDVGSSFFTTTTRVILSENNVQISPARKGWANPPAWEYQRYVGPCLAVTPSKSLLTSLPSLHSSSEELKKMGSTAISRCAPTNPVADATVFIGEIVKEGIPALLGATLNKWKNLGRKERRRAIGSEYLNYEFGWKPIVNDLMKFVDAVDRADDILRQYERDSFRLIRRSYSFPPVETTTITEAGVNQGAWTHNGVGGFSPTNKIYRTRYVSKTAWFKGAFSYYYPPYDGTMRTDMARAAIKARKVLGIQLTPGAIWNLAPWSWAADWFSNAGDVLQNLDSWIIDGLVVRYGYMMETTIVRDTYTMVGPTGYPGNPLASDVIVESITKQRLKSSPYGFGLTWDTLSPRQIAIATSLGLSRS